MTDGHETMLLSGHDMDLLETEFNIYSYLTQDNKPGTIIAHIDLAPVFDKNKLFTMDDVSVKTVKLRDIIGKGFISVGSTDLMDTLDITYCAKNQNIKPLIKGKYLHGSRKKLIAKPTQIEFEYDPVSDDEICDFNDHDHDIGEQHDPGKDLAWLTEVTTDDVHNNNTT
jgi:hypothetical protein